MGRVPSNNDDDESSESDDDKTPASGGDIEAGPVESDDLNGDIRIEPVGKPQTCWEKTKDFWSSWFMCPPSAQGDLRSFVYLTEAVEAQGEGMTPEEQQEYGGLLAQMRALQGQVVKILKENLGHLDEEVFEKNKEKAKRRSHHQHERKKDQKKKKKKKKREKEKTVKKKKKKKKKKS